MNTADIGLLYSEHKQLLLNFLLRIVRNRDTAEDLCQETFEQIMKYGHTFKPERGSFPVWACTIARNLAYRRLRKSGRLEQAESEIASLPLAADQSHSLIESTLLKEVLAQIVLELPEPEQTIIKMKFLEGASVKEIAVATRASERTISRRTLKALDMVRARLVEQELLP